MQQFLKIVKRIRDNKKMTNQQIANEMGESLRTVERIFAGESEMTSFRLKRLISILDVHWATIIAAEDSDSDITWLLIDEIITMSPEIQESFLRMALAIKKDKKES